MGAYVPSVLIHSGHLLHNSEIILPSLSRHFAKATRAVAEKPPDLRQNRGPLCREGSEVVKMNFLASLWCYNPNRSDSDPDSLLEELRGSGTLQ